MIDPYCDTCGDITQLYNVEIVTYDPVTCKPIGTRIVQLCVDCIKELNQEKHHARLSS